MWRLTYQISGFREKQVIRFTMTTRLRGMTWDHPRGLDSLTSADKAIEKLTGISIDWKARSLLDFGDQPLIEFYKEFDLIILDHPHVPDAVVANTIIPFDGLLTADELFKLSQSSVGPSHDSYIYRGKQWALAIDAAAQVSAYRPDLISAPPTLWSEVLSLAKEGKLLWPHKPVDAFCSFATLIAQFGSPLCSTNSFINKQSAAETLDFMIELSHSVPSFCATSNPIDIAERLTEGSDYAVGVCMFGYSNYSRDKFPKNLLKYYQVPSFDGRARGSILGGAGIGISSASKNPELAAKAAMALCSEEIQVGDYLTGGGQPGDISAWKSPSANALTADFFANTLSTMQGAWVRPRILGWPELQFSVGNLIAKILHQRLFTAQDLQDIEDSYDKFIRE
jgi:multiple sugar transport system substrate-binding protein